MGGRSGGGANGGMGSRSRGGVRLSISDIKDAQKKVKAYLQKMTKAKNAYQKAMGGYWMAQGGENKNKAAAQVNKTYSAYINAKQDYDTAKSILDTKVAAYQKGIPYKANDIPLPF